MSGKGKIANCESVSEWLHISFKKYCWLSQSLKILEKTAAVADLILFCSRSEIAI
jgi:hypothetical protein